MTTRFRHPLHDSAHIFDRFSNAFDPSGSRSLFYWCLLSNKTTLAGAIFRVMLFPAGLPRPGTYCDLRFVPRVRKKRLHIFISAGNAAFSR